MQVTSKKTFRFGKFILDLRRGCLRTDNREVELRPKSFEVLRYLVESAGRLVPKDEIIEAVWPSVTVTDESLTRCISDIRFALEDADQTAIRTVPDVGTSLRPRSRLGLRIKCLTKLFLAAMPAAPPESSKAGGSLSSCCRSSIWAVVTRTTILPMRSPMA